MPATIITVVAICITTAFLVLWFWVARKELREKLSTVKSAKNQFAPVKNP